MKIMHIATHATSVTATCGRGGGYLGITAEEGEDGSPRITIEGADPGRAVIIPVTPEEYASAAPPKGITLRELAEAAAEGTVIKAAYEELLASYREAVTALAIATEMISKRDVTISELAGQVTALTLEASSLAAEVLEAEAALENIISGEPPRTPEGGTPEAGNGIPLVIPGTEEVLLYAPGSGDDPWLR